MRTGIRLPTLLRLKFQMQHSEPFASFIATVEQMASDARVWVLLDFMGKETRVQVDRQQIQAVSPAAE